MTGLSLPDDAGSLADAVVLAVRDGVARGALVPEETYSIYRLADELGVSRSPVREAITRLADAGLVQVARNRGFRVVVPTERDLAEIVEIRLALEPRAARLAAEQGADDALDAVADALATMTAAAERDDEATFWPADRAFHDAVLRAAGNARAAMIVEQLRATTALLGPPTTAGGRSLAAIVAEHAPIMEAVLGREGELAELRMREHLETTGALLTQRASATAAARSPASS